MRDLINNIFSPLCPNERLGTLIVTINVFFYQPLTAKAGTLSLPFPFGRERDNPLVDRSASEGNILQATRYLSRILRESPYDNNYGIHLGEFGLVTNVHLAADLRHRRPRLSCLRVEVFCSE